MQASRIDDELNPRARPITEDIGKTVAGGADKNIRLVVFMADRAVLDGDPGRLGELSELLVERLQPEIAGEVVAERQLARIGESGKRESHRGAASAPKKNVRRLIPSMPTSPKVCLCWTYTEAVSRFPKMSACQQKGLHVAKKYGRYRQ